MSRTILIIHGRTTLVETLFVGIMTTIPSLAMGTMVFPDDIVAFATFMNMAITAEVAMTGNLATQVSA